MMVVADVGCSWLNMRGSKPVALHRTLLHVIDTDERSMYIQYEKASNSSIHKSQVLRTEQRPFLSFLFALKNCQIRTVGSVATY